VGCPWKFSEQLRQLAVGSFRDVAIPGDQIIRIRIVKTLVGSEKGEELRERPFESDLIDDRLHLPVDSRDLSFADFVNLFRSQIGGRMSANRVLVISLTIR